MKQMVSCGSKSVLRSYQPAMATLVAVLAATLKAATMHSCAYAVPAVASERGALVALFAATGGTSGNWDDSTNWQNADPCVGGAWTGVTCSNDGHIVYVPVPEWPSAVGRGPKVPCDCRGRLLPMHSL